MMNRDPLQRPLAADATCIVDVLTVRQHLRPHEPLRLTLERLREEVGCCEVATSRATDWLTLDPDLAIGRLRRSELIQLARSVYRFWRQGVVQSPA